MVEQDKRDRVLELVDDPEMLCADGYDDAIIGVVERYGMGPVVLYDLERVLEMIQEQGASSREEALEHYYYNIVGAWMGDYTPAFATLLHRPGDSGEKPKP